MGMNVRLRTAAVVACAVTVAGLAGTPAASGASRNWERNLSSAVMPFNIAVNQQKVYVADGFAGTVSQVGGGTIVSMPGMDVAGVDLSADGKSMAWTWSNNDHSSTGLTIRTKGRADISADISGYELAHNPDGSSTYGIVAGGNPCAEAILGGLTGGPATYNGIIDSHPYSVARSGSGWLVADAGANAILRVDAQGHVSTMSVLPAQPVTLTQAMVDGLAASMGAPAGSLDCLVGVTYAFEPVPTDVEVDNHGMVWVSVLPGGPEDPSLGARGAVYRINPSTGAATRVAGGFAGATNLAVADDGTVYVAELFGGGISKISGGTVSLARSFPGAVSVEVHGGYLYVGQMGNVDFETGQVLAPGSVMRFKR
jgi:hypothetical protein